MPIDDRYMDGGARGGVMALLASATAAEVRAEDRLQTAIDDVFLPDAARLDDRTRLSMTMLLTNLAATIERGLRRHAARLLVARDEPVLADLLDGAAPAIMDRLIATGLLRDPAIMREILGRVQQDLIAEALPTTARDDPESASLLPRLIQHPDPIIGASASALMAAENRRRLGGPVGAPQSTDLPAKLHRQLIWWIAAALRGFFADKAGTTLPALDRALAEAALRAIAAHSESDRLESVAMRLAAALDPRLDERAALLVEALLDRRLSLFVALIAHGLALDYADAREIILDPGGERLWLLLRVLDLDRASIARIGLSLSEADPRRDLDTFADSLDDIVAIEAVAARHALAPLLLHRDYRAALTALARGTRRSVFPGWPA